MRVLQGYSGLHNLLMFYGGGAQWTNIGVDVEIAIYAY